MEVRFNLNRLSERRTLILMKCRLWRGKLPFVYSTGEKIEPKLWDKKRMRAKAGRSQPELTDLNNYLQMLESEVRSMYLSHLAERRTLTKQAVINHLDQVTNRQVEERMTIFKFIDLLIQERTKPGKNRGSQAERIAVWKNRLLDYQAFQRKSIDFNDINWTFLSDFPAYLYEQHGHSVNYAKKGISCIASYVREARKRGYTENSIPEHPDFSIKGTKTNKPVLYIDELELIQQIDWNFERYEDYNRERLRRIVDFVIVGTFTGLRINMFQKINPGLVKRFRGVEIIEVWTQKTDEQVAIPLFPQLKAVLEKHDYILPKISEQEFRRALKIVCKLAGINETFQWRDTSGGILKITPRPKWEVITPHALRRSFATNFYLMGFPASTLMKITGHSTEKQFQEYINTGTRLNAANLARQVEMNPNFLKLLNKSRQ